MTFPVLVRRTHLYLGAMFVPWFVMFAASSFVLNHPNWFTGLSGNGVTWKSIAEKPYAEVPPNDGLRDFAVRILADLGLDASRGFGVSRPNANLININLPNFAHPVRVAYRINEGRLVAEQRDFAWSPTLANMHTRDGYYLDAPRQTLWAVLVDLVCVAMLLWVASGLYMWWNLRATRLWGWLAIAGGLASFTALMIAL